MSKAIVKMLLEPFEKVGDKGIYVHGSIVSMWTTGKMVRQPAGQYTSDAGEGGLTWESKLPCDFYLEGVEDEIEAAMSSVAIAAMVFRRLAAELDTEIVLNTFNHEGRLIAQEEIDEATAEKDSRKVGTMTPKKKDEGSIY